MVLTPTVSIGPRRPPSYYLRILHLFAFTNPTSADKGWTCLTNIVQWLNLRSTRHWFSAVRPKAGTQEGGSTESREDRQVCLISLHVVVDYPYSRMRYPSGLEVTLS